MQAKKNCVPAIEQLISYDYEGVDSSPQPKQTDKLKFSNNKQGQMIVNFYFR